MPDAIASEICARYGQVYNTGTLRTQLGSVVRQLVVNAVPGPASRGFTRVTLLRQMSGLRTG